MSARGASAGERLFTNDDSRTVRARATRVFIIRSDAADNTTMHAESIVAPHRASVSRATSAVADEMRALVCRELGDPTQTPIRWRRVGGRGRSIFPEMRAPRGVKVKVEAARSTSRISSWRAASTRRSPRSPSSPAGSSPASSPNRARRRAPPGGRPARRSRASSSAAAPWRRRWWSATRAGPRPPPTARSSSPRPRA